MSSGTAYHHRIPTLLKYIAAKVVQIRAVTMTITLPVSFIAFPISFRTVMFWMSDFAPHTAVFTIIIVVSAILAPYHSFIVFVPILDTVFRTVAYIVAVIAILIISAIRMTKHRYSFLAYQHRIWGSSCKF